jgi:hypothetical protein
MAAVKAGLGTVRGSAQCRLGTVPARHGAGGAARREQYLHLR